MNFIICDAIKNKQRLRFSYNGKIRIIEPQAYGIGHKGTELLRGHQVIGGSQPEPLFDLGKVEKIEVLDEHFKIPGPNYKKGDSAMKQIFCEL